MSTSQPSFDFNRTYGVRHISTHAEDTITSISRSDWLSFRDSLENITSSGDAGDFVLGPELITSTDIPLGEIAVERTVIEERVHEATLLTISHPDTTLLLGTAVFDGTADRPRNAVLFLQDGREIGRTYKTYIRGAAERQSFHRRERPEVQKPAPHIAALICSDLVAPPDIIKSADTLLISSCWGAPGGHPGFVQSTETSLKDALPRYTQELFDNNPSLETVIMADRVPEGSQALAPFNFVATRMEG